MENSRKNFVIFLAARRIGGNFRMEDEEGELFDNTYLDELKRGSGRDSLTLDEIQRRNSMLPPHLRSSYMPQYSNDEPKVKMHIRIFVDACNQKCQF